MEIREIKRYLSILRYRWWILLLGTLLAGSSAFISSSGQQPVYEAKTLLLINQGSGSSNATYSDILASEQLANTYTTLLTNRQVLDETISNLGLSMGPDALKRMISVQSVRNTQLITLAVDYTNPDLAANIANTLAQVFIKQNEAFQANRFLDAKNNITKELNDLSAQIQQTETNIANFGSPDTPEKQSALQAMQSELAQYNQSYFSLLQSYETIRVSEATMLSNVVQVEPAAIPASPVSPNIPRNTILAAIVGLMLMLGVVFFLEYIDDTIKTPEDAIAALNLPVIGLITHISKLAGDEPYVVENARSPIAEAFRALRTNTQLASVGKPIKTILVTSAMPGEGKTFIASNLAVIMAQGGKKVILADLDLRRPGIHQSMGLPNRIGVSHLFMQERIDFNGILRPWKETSVSVITSGGIPPNPAELLGSEKMNNILAAMKERADIVIIDSPPVSSVTDSVLLAARADAVLFVVQPKRTRRGSIHQALEQLNRANARTIGLVFDNVKLGRSGYYDSEYYHYYSHDYEKEKPAAPNGILGKRKHPESGHVSK
jgi:succinoglycan biosynthesis transport protein ExoP